MYYVFIRSILCHIELDYFEEAVDFLYRQNYVKTSQGIGVVGISKAAEIALLMGTYFEDKVILHKIKSKDIEIYTLEKTYDIII